MARDDGGCLTIPGIGSGARDGAVSVFRCTQWCRSRRSRNPGQGNNRTKQRINHMLYRPSASSPQLNPSKLRHRCRNPKCRGELDTPVENERDAFCCVRCHDGFFRAHCRVCQEPFTSKTGNKAHRVLCDRSQCRADFRANPGAFWGRSYPRPISVKRTPNLSTISKPKMALESSRGWRQVAGPDLSSVGLPLRHRRSRGGGRGGQPRQRSILA